MVRGMSVSIGGLMERLLTPGARHRDDDHDYLITMVPAGEVVSPSGRIGACDPLSYAETAAAFEARIPPGRYPLRAWVAVVHSGGPRSCEVPLYGLESDRRTAALQLVVRDEPAARWEPAALAGDGPGGPELDEDGFAAYPVDSGTATFADVGALRALARWPYERVEDAYPGDGSLPAPAVSGAVTDEATGANVIAVTTGWGDGSYATFLGRSATGEITSFVTDFRVV
jgi:hypothetical protein